ncbi:hypothetical protein Tco_0155288 [Tanacetum coccineum]
MTANQAIEYALQCGDLTMESLVFQTNNVVGNFNYPQNVPAYKPTFKEFWCTAIAYDPNPPADETRSRPLKEYLIKFSAMNGKKPLTLDFKTFTTSTGLDYNNAENVAHPSPKAVKAELAKIVLSGNYSSTEQINSIRQMIAFCLMTRKKVDIEEIIYNDLITKLTNKSRKKYVSYLRFISCALTVLLGTQYTQDENFRSLPDILSNSNFSKDPSKVTEIKLTTHMIAINNQKDSVSPLPCSGKKKKVKSHTMTPTLPK